MKRSLIIHCWGEAIGSPAGIDEKDLEYFGDYLSELVLVVRTTSQDPKRILKDLFKQYGNGKDELAERCEGVYTRMRVLPESLKIVGEVRSEYDPEILMLSRGSRLLDKRWWRFKYSTSRKYKKLFRDFY